MKTHITCPCGEAIVGKDEDELVELTQAHLASVHPGLSTTATQFCSWRTNKCPPNASARAPVRGHARSERKKRRWPFLRHHRGADRGHELALFLLGGDLPEDRRHEAAEPVSAIAVNVVGPSGLMSGRGSSVTAPGLARGQVHPGDVQRQLLHLSGSRGADSGEHVGGLARPRTGKSESWPAPPPTARLQWNCCHPSGNWFRSRDT